jgi:acetyl-CoA acetyltransferase
MDRAAIIGVGTTKIEKSKVGETFADMAWEAVNKALNDAGMTIDDIDNVVGRQDYFLHGRG